MARRFLVVVVAISYLLTISVSPQLKPGYDWVSQYISELGAVGTPHATLISYGGFMVFGVLAAAMLWVTVPRLGLTGGARFAAWLLICEPIAWIGAALAPCDPGCPMEGSLSQVLHNALGIFTYLGTAVALFMLTGSGQIVARYRVLWGFVGAFWLAMFLAMGAPELSQWRGLAQRLAEWVLYPALLIAAWRIAGSDPPAVPQR